MSTAFVITGRSLKDWQIAGVEPPPDLVRLRCIGCEQEVTISADAGRKMAEAKREGMDPCGALCTPCLAVCLADDGIQGKVAGITASEHGRALLERNERARALAEIMRARQAKP
jgi:hypothetical protein